jgi:Lipase (class 3)
MSRALNKQEAILYGRFVTAAYAMFKRDRTLLRPEPAPGDIPAPYELVAWLNMSDFVFWRRETPKFYGFIARHQQQKHNFVLAIRGTEGWVEWLDDAVVRLVPFGQAGRVEGGFDKIYSTLKVVKRHAGVGVAPAAKPNAAGVAAPAPEIVADSFTEQLEQLADTLEEPAVQEQMRIAKEKRPRRSFVVTGHSLGSALATLFVMENKEKNKFDISTICTFASPRVGNAEFVRQFNLLPLDSWRIVNRRDIVPKLPLHIPVLFDYQHVATLSEFSSAGVVKWNPGCWHSMSTYLHWLDPSIGVDAECKR